MSFSRKKRLWKSRDELQTVEYRVRVCRDTANKLQEMEKSDNGLPIYRLIQIAVDNEFEKPEPFKFPLKWKDEPYVEDKYAHEAQLMFEFIKNYTGTDGNGGKLNLLMLILLRRRYGIIEREKCYRAYCELLRAGIIEEYTSKRTPFQYPKWFKHVRIVRDRPPNPTPQQFIGDSNE